MPLCGISALTLSHTAQYLRATGRRRNAAAAGGAGKNIDIKK